MNTLNWLQEWYKSHCDGNWEHSNGIDIKTLDNPGWDISINIDDLGMRILDQDWILVEEDESNWYGYKIENGVCNASGDPSKLDFLILLFKDKVDSSSNEVAHE